MDGDRVDADLRVIRSLIERAAIYRRALGPVLLLTGAGGALAALAAPFVLPDTGAAFLGYWLGLAAGLLAADLLLVRWQARRRGERMWSPPARRAARALVPAFASGAALALWIVSSHPSGMSGAGIAPILTVVWLLFYGAGAHAATAYMPGELRLLGWLFLLAGLGVLLALSGLETPPAHPWPHAVMGLAFGGIHLVYGAYLLRVEARRRPA